MPPGNVGRAGRDNIMKNDETAGKKKRRPFLAASGISTDHSLSEYILAFRNTSLLTSAVVSCDMSLSGFPSSSNYRRENLVRKCLSR